MAHQVITATDLRLCSAQPCPAPPLCHFTSGARVTTVEGQVSVNETS